MPDLATRRLEVVRAAFKQAGAESDRLTETKLAERTSAETQVELEVLEPQGPQPSKVRQILRRLGAPLKDGDDD